MNIQVFVSFIEVVQSLFCLRQYEVRFEADDIMQEAPELVDLAPDLDVGSGVLLEEGAVLADLALQLGQLLGGGVADALLLKDVQVLQLGDQQFELGDGFYHFGVKLLQLL